MTTRTKLHAPSVAAATTRPSVTRHLLVATVGATVVAAPAVVLPRVEGAQAPPSLYLLAAPLVGVLLLLGVHRPLWAVAALPATAVVGLRELGGGVQVVQVLAAGAAGCVALAWVLAPRPLPRSRPLLWATALVLVALAATAVSDRLVLALRADVGLVLGLLTAVAVVLTCRRRQDLVLVLRAAAAGSLVVTLPVLAQLDGLQGAYGGASVAGRPVGVFVQPNELGSFAVSTVWMSFALVALARRRGDKLLGLVASGAAAAAMLFSLSRGAWTGAAAGVVVVVLLHPPVWRAVVVVGLGLGLVGAGVAVAAPSSAPAAVLVERASTLGSGATNPEDRRDLVRQEAVRLIGTAPVLGHGPGSYAPEAAGWDSPIAQYRRAHAHNVLLNVGAETGLLGAGALLALTASTAAAAVRTARKARRDGARERALVVGLLGAGCASFAVHGLVDVTYQNPLVMSTTWVLLGLLLATTTAARGPVSSSPGRELHDAGTGAPERAR